MHDVTARKLVHDARILLSDSESLIRETAAHTGEQATALRARMKDSMAGLGRSLADLEARAEAGAKSAAQAADGYVYRHPWGIVGAAGGAAFLLGLILGRRAD